MPRGCSPVARARASRVPTPAPVVSGDQDCLRSEVVTVLCAAVPLREVVTVLCAAVPLSEVVTVLCAAVPLREVVTVLRAAVPLREVVTVLRAAIQLSECTSPRPGSVRQAHRNRRRRAG